MPPHRNLILARFHQPADPCDGLCFQPFNGLSMGQLAIYFAMVREVSCHFVMRVLGGGIDTHYEILRTVTNRGILKVCATTHQSDIVRRKSSAA